MSYPEAKADGIRISKDEYGFTSYHPPCHVCGAETSVWSYLQGNQYTCRRCRQTVNAAKAEKKLVSQESMHENAHEFS